MVRGYFPQEEYEDRWTRVHREMERRGLEAAVVWSRSMQSQDRAGDVLYLTNYYAPEASPDTHGRHAWGYYAVILQPGETPELVAEAADVRNEFLATDRVSRHRDVVDGVVRRLEARRLEGAVAFTGATVLPYRYGREMLGRTPDIDWREDEDLVLALRRIKSPRELDCMREGGANGAAALDILMKEMVRGTSEREAVAEALRELCRRGNGGSYISVNHGDTIGYWCRDPLLGRGGDAPRDGDLVRGWMDTTFQGYWFDHGRTAVAGSAPTAEQRQLIGDCASIVETIQESVRPGATGDEIAAAARAAVEAAGGDDGTTSQIYSVVAHGTGLFWEPPFINLAGDNADEPIEAGMVMGVEYFLSRPGVGTAGIEENFIVAPERNESLTNLPMLGW
ncbi:MAG: M24 family metallopeptidase [bacterium]|nr:M24 family metallopeptidase [bacterium]